ncbi:hypothetical protein [Streptomyces sp. PR69]|uniref:hypothetical protein n=1 Tax=Streptomyces sp. PR69 TaxID=2984950 RepID=UPI003A5C4C6A
MHTVALLALDGVIAFGLATPLEAFALARLPDGRAACRVLVCSPPGEIDAGTLTRVGASPHACRRAFGSSSAVA